MGQSIIRRLFAKLLKRLRFAPPARAYTRSESAVFLKELPHMKPLFGLAVCALALLVLSSRVHAQGVQTGTITGIVQSSDGLSLPGVTVTATSPSLQGQRIAVTDVTAVFFIKGLPAGTYSVRFDIPSFQTTTTDKIALTVGGAADGNPTLPGP